MDRDAPHVQFDARVQASLGYVNKPALRGASTFLWGRISSKIIVPYLFMMFVVAMLATYVVLRLVSDSLEQRYISQLLDAGKAVNDGVVRIEGEQLALLRLMANTEGVDVALQQRDARTLSALLTPLEANSGFRYVDVVGLDGTSILTMRPGNDLAAAGSRDLSLGTWDVTRKSLSGQADSIGDKYSQLVRTNYGTLLYSGGPVRDAHGTPVGAILIGSPIRDVTDRFTGLVQTDVTIYVADGSIADSTLRGAYAPTRLDPRLYTQATASPGSTLRRTMIVGNKQYLEVIGSLFVRDSVAGALGVSVPTSYIEQSGARTRNQLVAMFVAIICVVLLVGLFLARSIATPIQRLVRACLGVTKGDLDQQVPVSSSDETGLLTTTFNEMVRGLKERDFIRATFGRYVSKQVSDVILRGGLRLGGEQKNVTVLISDIRGFTAISEGMKPEQLVAFLNHYFGQMIDVILRYEGTLDKFMGDSIMVVFGAPIDHDDHATRAVMTALEMRSALDSFNREIVAQGLSPIRIGVGINSGEVIAGNIGSEERMEYTVIGDIVNTAARLEKLNKELGTDILIAESTYELLERDMFDFGDPETIQMRGRSQHTDVHPVLRRRPGSSIGPAMAELPDSKIMHAPTLSTTVGMR